MDIWSRLVGVQPCLELSRPKAKCSVACAEPGGDLQTPFHSRVRFACVAGEGAGVRGGQDKRDRGELLRKSVARPPA
jgi:hypothetical protein